MQKIAEIIDEFFHIKLLLVFLGWFSRDTHYLPLGHRWYDNMFFISWQQKHKKDLPEQVFDSYLYKIQVSGRRDPIGAFS